MEAAEIVKELESGMGPVACMYGGRALMCTMCKGMCIVSMYVHAVSCSLYAVISKYWAWRIVCLSVYFTFMCQYLYINNAFTSSL